MQSVTEQQHRTRVSGPVNGRYVVICDVCNVAGRPDGEEYEGDAQAIADRHAEVGGFDS